jgi:hypothetical protein
VTRSSHPAHPDAVRPLFRPAGHVFALPEGSALTILDLDRGVAYATTPFGAESWHSLVSGARGLCDGVVRAPDDGDGAEDREAWARVAGYFLDCRVIEPVGHDRTSPPAHGERASGRPRRRADPSERA